MNQTDKGPAHIFVVPVLVSSSVPGIPGSFLGLGSIWKVDFLHWQMFWEGTGHHHPSSRPLTCNRSGRYFLG